MDNRKLTPLAFAIEEIINKNKQLEITTDYAIGRNHTFLEVLHILRSLKPKEMEIINNAFLDGYCNNDLNIDSNNYCQQTLTQE